MFSTNGFVTGALAALLATAQFASAHMEIKEPAPLRSKFNANANPGTIDYTNTAPLAANGANYPCKGYHSDMGTPAGKATASYRPGGSYSFEVTGAAPHGGGSCQVSLSYDQGKTFTVIQSIIGSCPLASTYPFTIPDDAPEGEALWAWTWQNKIGNREQYMNCAVVQISKSAAKREVATPELEAPAVVEKRASVAFSARPPVFIANIENGCSVAEGTDVEYPNPGPDVVVNGGNLTPPSGSCGGSAPAPAPNPAPVPTTTAQAPVVTTAAPTPTQTPKLPGGIFVTVPSGGIAPISSTAAPAVSSAPVAQPTPSTLIVSTRPAASSPAVVAPSPSAVPAPVPSKGAYAVGTTCASEGAWNCIGGTSFQRCASGQWSAVISMAAGTKCTAGEGATLESAKKVRRSAKFRQLA
ncbi:hypothetical protein QBC35DRAFT_516452 [Podospora australis]|uniref:Lytic polysaccharide monooxygenase n=1 Tax=Podospora australis TaxID=1536484 RepID=A0AAN7AHG6_9PEZI|nr:hypothetical protein QBC35DRAFT_516452 [Podospora australis]